MREVQIDPAAAAMTDGFMEKLHELGNMAEKNGIAFFAVFSKDLDKGRVIGGALVGEVENVTESIVAFAMSEKNPVVIAAIQVASDVIERHLPQSDLHLKPKAQA